MDVRMEEDVKELTLAIDDLYDALAESRTTRKMTHGLHHVGGLGIDIEITISIAYEQCIVFLTCRDLQVFGPISQEYSRQRGDKGQVGPRIDFGVSIHGLMLFYEEYIWAS